MRVTVAAWLSSIGRADAYPLVCDRESFRREDPAQKQAAKVKLIERECRRLGERQRNIEDVLQEHVLQTETHITELQQSMFVPLAGTLQKEVTCCVPHTLCRDCLCLLRAGARMQSPAQREKARSRHGC